MAATVLPYFLASCDGELDLQKGEQVSEGDVVRNEHQLQLANDPLPEESSLVLLLTCSSPHELAPFLWTLWAHNL